MTTATYYFNYASGSWSVTNVNLGGITYSPAQLKRMLTEEGRYRYPEICERRITSFTYNDGRYSCVIDPTDDVLPSVMTLEESIVATKSRMIAVLSYLRK